MNSLITLTSLACVNWKHGGFMADALDGPGSSPCVTCVVFSLG